MAQHTPIRRHHPFTRIPADGSEHPPFRTCPQDAIEAKNLRMSHLSTQHVRVSFLDTLYAKDRKRFIARCVPFSLRHEYESSMNVRLKNGESWCYRPWGTSRPRTLALVR